MKKPGNTFQNIIPGLLIVFFLVFILFYFVTVRKNPITGLAHEHRKTK